MIPMGLPNARIIRSPVRPLLLSIVVMTVLASCGGDDDKRSKSSDGSTQNAPTSATSTSPTSPPPQRPGTWVATRIVANTLELWKAEGSAAPKKISSIEVGSEAPNLDRVDIAYDPGSGIAVVAV